MQKFFIKNVSCASCAAKIENKLRSLPFVKYINISTSTNTLFIDTSDIESVKNAIKEIEPEVEISNKEVDNNDFNAKKNLIFLCSLISIFISLVALTRLTKIQFIEDIAPFIMVVLYAISGRDVVLSALRSISKYDFFNENSLMFIATTAAFAINAYEEAVAVMLFFRTGEFFQELAVNNSKRSIKALLEIAPNITHLKVDSKIIDITPEELEIGNIIVVRSGEKIPTDGIVISGESQIDLKALTGESIPKKAIVDSKVFGGSINLDGLLEIKVTKLYKDTSIFKIIDMVQNASASKTNTESFITSFARVYTPIVFFAALFFSIVPPLLGFGSYETWIQRSLVMLMVSCPCALVVSVPLAYFGGIGSASKNYVLVKGANFLEALNSVESIAFDKTGTLTKGVFKVVKIEAYNGYSKEDVLQYAYCAENFSTHPIASAIKEEYANLNLNHQCNNTGFKTLSGLGIKATCNFEDILVGNDRLLHEYNIEHSTCNVNGTVAHIAVDNKYVGYIIISDEIKEDSKEAIADLKKLGVKKIVMLTGDNEFASNSIAKTLELDDVKYNLLPEDKVEYFKQLKSQTKGKSIFVGDGINDAPSIALADIGVSMGKLGSDVSKESADIVIINDSIKSLAKAILISRKTKTIIWQNIIFALGVKALFIVLGLFGIASMWEAVFGDVGVSLIALFNSMRILKV